MTAGMVSDGQLSLGGVFGLQKRKELKMVMLLWLHRESVIIQVCGQKFEGKRAQVQFRVEVAVEVCILRF